jgi:hypothetical protein
MAYGLYSLVTQLLMMWNNLVFQKEPPILHGPFIVDHNSYYIFDR